MFQKPTEDPMNNLGQQPFSGQRNSQKSISTIRKSYGGNLLTTLPGVFILAERLAVQGVGGKSEVSAGETKTNASRDFSILGQAATWRIARSAAAGEEFTCWTVRVLFDNSKKTLKAVLKMMV